MTHATRNIVVDLWPLYLSGEASADTRALVEAFIAADPEFGERLRKEESLALQPANLTLPVDHERATLIKTQKRRARQSMIVNSLALLVSAGMTAYYAWGIVPRLALTFAGLGQSMPVGMLAAANGSAWILRLGVPFGILMVPLIWLFRKRLALPRFLESGTVLAVLTGVILVVAQLCWLTLLNEASTALLSAARPR